LKGIKSTAMEIQFDYIKNIAKQYHIFNTDDAKLYEALNELDESQLNSIYNEYGAIDNDFRPVNLLRSECARYLLEGNKLSPNIVDEIKENIRTKNTDAFLHYPEVYINQIKEYRVGKRDMFANWQNQWSIFYTFLYRDQVKETTQQYLLQLCEMLLIELELTDYKFHWVGFNGANNFGAHWSWLALFPEVKKIHIEMPINFLFYFQINRKQAELQDMH
jgi:5-methylcytosine-specific restriction protein B